MKKIEEILKYRNDRVIIRFMNSFDIDYEESSDIFREMLKWLYVKGNSIEQKKIGFEVTELSVVTAMIVVDEMWHSFILHTKDYKDFCTEFFGFFIHHEPYAYIQKKQIDVRNTLDIKPLDIQHYKQIMEYCYDTIGEETAFKWFYVYPKKYSREKLNQIKQDVWAREY